MKIESVAIVESVLQAADGDLIHTLPPIEAFIHESTPGASRRETFYAFLNVTFSPTDGGKRFRYEATILSIRG
jgi:hypothetical protein